MVSRRKDGGWAVEKLLWDTQDRKDEGGQVRTAKLHQESGSCSDRTGRHWQNDGDGTTIGEVRGAELWQGREKGIAERAARKLAAQRRKWPQEAVSTELPGGWRCPQFSVGHL